MLLITTQQTTFHTKHHFQLNENLQMKHSRYKAQYHKLTIISSETNNNSYFDKTVTKKLKPVNSSFNELI